MRREDVRNFSVQDYPHNENIESRIHFILRYAVLAPSTHNSQPWLFSVTENSCTVFIDRSVQIQEADPEGRDLYISIGCCIENIVLAAQYFGLHTRVELGEDANEHVAQIFFEEDAVEENYPGLFHYIVKRQNVRGIFENKIPEISIEELRNLNIFDGIQIHMSTDRKKIAAAADMTAEAITTAYSRSSFRQEMSQWIHHNYSKERTGLHGYTLGVPVFLSFILPYIIRWFNVGKKLAGLNKQTVTSSPAICVFTAEENTRAHWVNTGRLAERVMLFIQSRGYQTAIYVASIEIGDFRSQLQDLFHLDNEPQFLFCFGKINAKFPYTPRISHAEKIRKI